MKLILLIGLSMSSIAYAELEQGLTVRVDKRRSGTAYGQYRKYLSDLIRRDDVDELVRTSAKGSNLETVCLQLNEVNEARFSQIKAAFDDLANSAPLSYSENEGNCSSK